MIVDLDLKVVHLGAVRRGSRSPLVVKSEVGVGVDRVRGNTALQLGERNVVDEECRGLANYTHDVWL